MHIYTYVTSSDKTGLKSTQDLELKSTFCLYVKTTLMHYPETPSTPMMARSAFIDDFLPMLLNNMAEDAFLDSEGQ